MEPITITAFFTALGVPQLGLTPAIKIRVASTGLLVVDSAIMFEIGDGQYSYNFSTALAGNLYTAVIDGGSTLPDSERWTYSSFEIPAISLTASFN